MEKLIEGIQKQSDKYGFPTKPKKKKKQKAAKQ